MALVDYSDSDEDQSSPITTTEPKPNTTLPPLPKKFHDQYASTARISTKDDPSLHGGRTRGIPHKEGNWSTHVYIEWFPLTSEQELLSNLLSELKNQNPTEAKKLQTFLTSELGAPLPLHISLSRPIVFTTENKGDFLESLQTAIKSSKIQPFDIAISDLSWCENFEKTRWFLVLKVKTNSAESSLNKLLYVCNQVVEQFDQPPLYTKPAAQAAEVQDASEAFHISIAWTLEDPDISLLENVTAELDAVKGITINVEEVKAKIGNAVTSIDLTRRKRILAEGKLFGV